MSKKIILITIFSFINVFTSANAESYSDRYVWQHTAMACVPTANTIEQRKYVTTGGKVKFKSNKIGKIVFICPITTSLPNESYKILANFNYEVPINKGKLIVQLRRSHNETGNVDTILENTHINQLYPNLSEIYRETYSDLKQINFNFFKYTYWVQLNIKRTDTKHYPLSILSVKLSNR